MTKPNTQTAPISTRTARWRFAAALTVYGLWVVLLAAMAIVAGEPPDPRSGVMPGHDRSPEPDAAVPDGQAR